MTRAESKKRGMGYNSPRKQVMEEMEILVEEPEIFWSRKFFSEIFYGGDN
jgi:hypothetical protein